MSKEAVRLKDTADGEAVGYKSKGPEPHIWPFIQAQGVAIPLLRLH